MSSDDYVSIECTLRAITKNAVKIEAAGIETWIPRSLVHGCDDSSLDRWDVDDEITLRIFWWKAEQEGLV